MRRNGEVPCSSRGPQWPFAGAGPARRVAGCLNLLRRAKIGKEKQANGGEQKVNGTEPSPPVKVTILSQKKRPPEFAMPTPRSIRLSLVLAASLFALSACVGPAPYAPRPEGGMTGYTDQQITANRFRVTFRGNSVTPRRTVEDYLLLRSAEVTLAAGYTHFLFDTRNTEAQTRYDTVPGPGYGFGYEYWRFRPRWGYAPFGPEVEIVTTTRYESYAEIVLMKPDQAAKEPRAVDAREVIAHMTPPPPPR